MNRNEVIEMSKGWLPHRTTNDDIAVEQNRFDKAQKLIADGNIEEARKLFWWPKNEDPPKRHWSRVGVHICLCGKVSPDGIYALCGYCGGTCPQTPSLIARRGTGL